MEAELEFRNIEIGKAQELVKMGEQAAVEMEERVSSLSGVELMKLLPSCFTSLVASRQKVGWNRQYFAWWNRQYLPSGADSGCAIG